MSQHTFIRHLPESIVGVSLLISGKKMFILIFYIRIHSIFLHNMNIFDIPISNTIWVGNLCLSQDTVKRLHYSNKYTTYILQVRALHCPSPNGGSVFSDSVLKGGQCGSRLLEGWNFHPLYFSYHGFLDWKLESARGCSRRCSRHSTNDKGIKPQNLNYAIINSPTSLVLTPDHNKVETVQLQKLSFVVKDYSLNTVVWVIGAMIDP